VIAEGRSMSLARRPTDQPEAAVEPTAFERIVTADRELEIRREGVRLSLFVRGKPLNEDQAQVIALAHLGLGERLLAAIDDSSDARFTFVVWPRPMSHLGRLLDELRAA
jgi:hypothetical protein